MPIAKWSDELTTGVSEVDRQHQELIRLVNDFHDALLQGRGREVVEKTIGFLSNYVAEHFKMEEQLMMRHNYTGFAAHKREHERFISEFTALAGEFSKTANNSFAAITVQKQVVQWLVNHIMKVDKEMAKFLKTKLDGQVA